MTSRIERVARLHSSGLDWIDRPIAEEAAVAVEFNGIGYAVMMMTPADLPAFALGFALTERIAASPADVLDVDVADVPAGIILRVTVSASAAERIGERIRHRTSDTGCGLCGIASLEGLIRPLPAPPPAPDVPASAIFTALDAVRGRQALNIATGAVHAAAWCDTSGAIRHIAEDVGRHNALDKLIGMIGGTAAQAARLSARHLTPQLRDGRQGAGRRRANAGGYFRGDDNGSRPRPHARSDADCAGAARRDAGDDRSA